MMFLGTGAAEGIPAMFCQCNYCSRVRKNGRGKNFRTRSSFRIDSRHQIDFSPDCFYQMTDYGLDIYELEHLLITHSHDDHFSFMEILTRESAVPENSKPLYIYMHTNGIRWVKEVILNYVTKKDELTRLLDKYRFVHVDYFQTFKAGDIEVISLKANHKGFGRDEYGLNYLITLKNGQKMLYATDTGWYEEETWEYLKGKKTDIVIMESTFGGRLDRGTHPDSHLDIRGMLNMLEKMDNIGFIDNSTQIYTTHINHKHDLLHDEMQAAFDKSSYKVTVAYDGLKIL